MCRDAGFSLVELVVVMIVISVGFLGLASMFRGTVSGLVVNEASQQTGQYAQECAERVLALRRDQIFSSVSTSNSSTICDTTALGALPSGFTRGVNVSSTTTGTSTGPCPNGVQCKNVTVTVCKGSVVNNACPSGTVGSVVTIMLVDY